MRSLLVCIATIISLFALVRAQCDMVCAEIHSPVCAQLEDGTSETFSNACIMGLSLCLSNKRAISSYEGECTPVVDPACDRMCATYYDPICAQLDDGTSQTFGNGCEMDVALCQSKKRAISSYAGECEPVVDPACDRMCATYYDPICAQLDDGTSQTFGNGCEMGVALCQSKKRVVNSYKGECAASDSCDRMCPMYVDPVCAILSDGSSQTFSNACVLEVALCKSKKRVLKSYRGNCKSVWSSVDVIKNLISRLG